MLDKTMRMETAKEAVITPQTEVQAIQQNKTTTLEKVLMMEYTMKISSLKFRRIPEGAETNTDLAVFMANWLTSFLQLEDGVMPLLTKACRAATANNPKRLAYPK